jgi:hypothetical protein
MWLPVTPLHMQVYDHNLSQLLSNVEAEGKPAAAAKQ